MCCAYFQVDRMKRKQRNIGNRIQLAIDEMLHLLGNSSNSSADIARGRSLQLTKLEERVLMSASPLAMVAEVATIAVDSSSIANPAITSDFDLASAEMGEFNNVEMSFMAGTDADNANGSVTSATARGIELIVIDSRVQDADTLLENLLNTDRDFRLLRLDANSDGLTQISERLEQLGNVSAIHLLTHGNTGEILLGSTVLNADTLAQHAPELVAWQHNLTANADILLYGCDVVKTPEGREFAEALARLTDADVAASDDDTGHASLGGDWDLEFTSGTIETAVAFTIDLQQDWYGVLTYSTYRDSFSAFAFNNSDGTQTWSSNPWQEIGESNGPGSGQVSVNNYLGEDALMIRQGGKGASRLVNLTGAESATLTFEYAQVGIAAGETVVLEITTDGTLWTQLATFNNTTTDTAFRSAGYDISSYIDTDTQIRFLATGANPQLYVDNLQVSYTTANLTNRAEFSVPTSPSTTNFVQETSGLNRGSQQAVATASDGSYVVVWSRQNQDTSGWGVYARRFDASGTAITGEMLVNQTTANNQKWARVGSAADGSFVVTWTQFDAAGNPVDVYARRFAANGTPLSPNEFIVNNTTSGIQQNSSIAVNSTGAFVITWEGNGPGDSSGIFARRFSAAGTALDGADIRVNFNVADTGVPSNASVAMDDAANFAVAWNDDSGMLAQRFDSDGINAGNRIIVDNDNDAGEGSIAMDADGDFVVVYKKIPIITSNGVYAQLYDCRRQRQGCRICSGLPTIFGTDHALREHGQCGEFCRGPRRHCAGRHQRRVRQDVQLGRSITCGNVGESDHCKHTGTVTVRRPDQYRPVVERPSAERWLH